MALSAFQLLTIGHKREWRLALRTSENVEQILGNHSRTFLTKRHINAEDMAEQKSMRDFLMPFSFSVSRLTSQFESRQRPVVYGKIFSLHIEKRLHVGPNSGW
jgi:hypothetical protein